MERIKMVLRKAAGAKLCAYGYILLATVLSLSFGEIKVRNTNVYEVYINGKQVGYTNSDYEAKEALNVAKQQLNEKKEAITLVDADLKIEETENKKSGTDTLENLADNMYTELEERVEETRQLAYTVKVNDCTVTLDSKESVINALNSAQNKYIESDDFTLALVEDTTNGTGGFTVELLKGIDQADSNPMLPAAVMEAAAAAEEDEDQTEKTQVMEIEFQEEIQIQETFVEQDQIDTVEDAVEEITREKDKNHVYVVKKGDTLSQIAQDHGMTLKELLQVNKKLNKESQIKNGDKVTVLIPETDFTVLVKQEETYEKNFKNKTIYVDNDDWYEDETEVLEKGKKGTKMVTAMVNYANGIETDREILDEVVIKDAVPTMIERGTKVRPTFIKPLNGGTFTSGFGPRWGRTHKGLDWACPVGTSVFASCGGTVSFAGEMNGYGNVVMIRHADGKQTRYAHLSEILVKTGQVMKQGEEIALSGNTGRSTGPHVHFEILIDGEQVNPFDYLD